MQSQKCVRGFLRWWVIFALIVLGLGITFHFGIVQEVFRKDITKLSFAISIIFLFVSLRIGIMTLNCRPVSQFHVFLANAFLTLGMIGTVIGFIYTLGGCFGGGAIDHSNMPKLLARMSIGLGTALYTTATGLICGLLLRLQLFNQEHHRDAS